VALAPGASVLDAAQLMREQRVSSVLLVDEAGRLQGIVTDRDLRNRVLAAGVSSDRPLREVATKDPVHVDVRAMAFDAMLLMARNNIHHVPVTDEGRVIGMVTATDLAGQHSSSAVYLAGEIHKRSDIDGLRQSAQRIRQLQRHLAAASATAYATGHVITAITDALTHRLLELGEALLGPAPIDYVWVAAGSQARCEQTAKSDQDNCLVLDDRYDPAVHGEYFRALSRFVCDGLDACGYIHCPGEMMAMTDTWRQPLRQWKRYFDQWVDKPEPKALMLTCVFFDLRAVHGQRALLDELRAEVLRRTRGNGIFLAHMVANALSREPPLGLFGQISTERSGEHRGTVDLKHHGIVPIVDLARVYALAAGHTAVNTHDRLEVAYESGEVSAQSARDLRDALEHLAAARIRHQARQIEADRPADNFLSLDELSNFERTQLKHAFSVVKLLQQVLASRYRGGLF
jgi:CBS domain-containing protein